MDTLYEIPHVPTDEERSLNKHLKLEKLMNQLNKQDTIKRQQQDFIMNAIKLEKQKKTIARPKKTSARRPPALRALSYDNNIKKRYDLGPESAVDDHSWKGGLKSNNTLYKSDYNVWGDEFYIQKENLKNVVDEDTDDDTLSNESDDETSQHH